MISLFEGCTIFNQPLNDWETNIVSSMNSMFRGCANFNQTINNWSIGSVIDMSSMFRGCSDFNQPLSGWGDFFGFPGFLENVSDMSYMFKGCTNFNQYLNDWNVSEVTDMSHMFAQCSIFNQYLNDWNVEKVTDMNNMFANCFVFNQDIGSWDVSFVLDMHNMFYKCFDFNGNVGLWTEKTTLVEDMSWMFALCNDFDQNIEGWDVSSVEDMFHMFEACWVFNQDLNAWNVINVLDMSGMFKDCYLFDGNISSWQVDHVQYMVQMFWINDVFNGDISEWNVGEVTDMSAMFYAAENFNQDIGDWNVENVTNMRFMFEEAYSFNGNIGNWGNKTAQVTNMEFMFDGYNDNINYDMAFDQDISSWDITSVTDMENMFFDHQLSTANYDALLIGWNAQGLNPNVNFDAGGSTYCSEEAMLARQNMIDTDGWNIIDNGSSEDDICCSEIDVSAVVTDETCISNGTIDLIVSAGNNSFLWSNSETTEDIEGLATGLYSVLINVQNTCTIEFETTVEDVQSINFDYPTTETATSSSNYNNQTISFGSDLVIPAGVTITISNSILLFPPDAGITVEEGGKLILNNTDVNAYDCADSWLGIEVRGTPSAYQGPNSTNTYGVHGVLILENNTSIRNAYIGATNSARNDNYGGPLHSGGKIKSTNSSFEDCWIAVHIQKYTNIGGHPLHCQFFNTKFKWTNDFPFQGYNSMVRMVWAKKVKFYGCKFENTNEDLFSGTNNSYYNAAMYMQKSTIDMNNDNGIISKMEGFNYGIVNFSKLASSIRNTEFRNYRSMWHFKNNATRITENTFGNMTANLEALTGQSSMYDPSWQTHYGIYLEYSTGFWIEGNTFNFPESNVNEAGIIVRASGEANNQIYDNHFENCFYATIAFDDNKSEFDNYGLKYVCNNFTQNDNTIIVDYIDSPQNFGWGISITQGSGGLMGVSAGNKFDVGNELKLDNYFDHVDYFKVNSENIDQINVDGDVAVFVVSNANSCETNLNKSKSQKQLSAIGYKNEAISFKAQLDNLVDGGDTEALSDEVIYANYTEALELYYELMSKSPNLSIKVMEEAIDKEYTLPPALLTLILQSNPTAGKSSKLQSKLDNRLIPLSEYQRYMIDQGKNLISEKEFLEAKWSYNESQFVSHINQAINLILFDETIEDKETEIDNLLSGYEVIEHHYMKIDRALEQENYPLAQSILNDIPTTFELKERQNQEWNDYMITYQILIDLEQSNAVILTTAQQDDLLIVAEKHSNSAAGLAWQILEHYTDTYVLEGLIEPGSHDKSLPRNEKEEVINPFENMQYIHVFPNPADDIAVLEFVGYESMLDMKLIDSNGKIVLSKTLNGKELQKTLKLGTFASGVYSLIINKGSEIIYNEQIVIKH